MDSYPDNWTELPHWCVMVRDVGESEERCAGHHPTIALAREQAARIRANRTYDHVRVVRTES